MRWKCRCRTRASQSPWTCTARSLAPVIKDIFMPLKTFSSNVTNAMPVKCSGQPLWGLPFPQLHPLILSECHEGGRPLLGGTMRAWRIIWMKDSELKRKSLNVSPLQHILSSSLTLLCSPSTAVWWHWEDRAGKPGKGHTSSTPQSLSPSGFLAVSLKGMVTIGFTSRLSLLLLYSLKDALLPTEGRGEAVIPEKEMHVKCLFIILKSLDIHAIVLDLLPSVHTLHLTLAFFSYFWLYVSPCCCQQYLSISGFEAWNPKELILNLLFLLSKANLTTPSSHWELLNHPGLDLRCFSLFPSLIPLQDLPIGLAQ